MNFEGSKHEVRMRERERERNHEIESDTPSDIEAAAGREKLTEEKGSVAITNRDFGFWGDMCF